MVPCQKILEVALKENVDMIGLSGLITPSLEEMAIVAKEMERQKIKIPLLVGGATTSSLHTAVKIKTNYTGPVVHVRDASHSVSVCRSLMDPQLKDEFIQKTKENQNRLHAEHEERQASRQFVSLDEARKKSFKTDWKQASITTPSFLGTKIFKSFDLSEIRKRIDWSPFFSVWEIPGEFPEILKDPKRQDEAQKLFDDANSLLDEIVSKKLLNAHAVVGFFPANSIGDDIELYTDDTRNKVLTVFHSLRQQSAKHVANAPFLALSDFVAPKNSDVKDYIGTFAVTAGIGIEKTIATLEKKENDYHIIMIKALADRLAEAFAETMHELTRKKLWGYAPQESLDNEALIRCAYRGIRPAHGYPACPDHTEKSLLFDLLQVEKNTGITLTENYAMIPAASICGLYFAHPKSKYFALGKINKDQIEDYAARKSMSVPTVEKWLAPYLGYTP